MKTHTTNTKPHTVRQSVTLAVLLIATMPFLAKGATTYTSDETGAWRTPTTWTADSGYPVAGDTVYITDGYTVTTSAGDAAAAVYVGDANATPLSQLTIAGDLTLSGQLRIGTTSSTYQHGKVVQNSGALTSTNAIYMAADISGTTASYEMAGGSISLNSSTLGFMVLGRDGTATFTQTGGDVTLKRGDASASYDISLILGSVSNSNGTYSISAGTITAVGFDSTSGETWIGQSGTGAMTISGTAQASLRSVILGQASGGTGTLNLSGGTLRTNRLSKGSTGTGTFNFSGGTLAPYNADATIGSATPGNNVTTTLSGTGATISSSDKDTLAKTVNVYSKLTGSGNITFTGNGTTKLYSADNDYTGTTTITGGTLDITTGGSIASSSEIIVADGATLLANTLTIGSGKAIGGDGSITGSLSLGEGAKFIFDGSGATLSVSGTVSLHGDFGVDDLLVDDWSLISDGTYTLIDNGSDFSTMGIDNWGSEFALEVGNKQFAYFQQGSLQLVVETIPEPSTLAVLGLALTGLMMRRRRMTA